MVSFLRDFFDAVAKVFGKSPRIEFRGWQDDCSFGRKPGDIITGSFTVYVDGRRSEAGFDIHVKTVGLIPEVQIYVPERYLCSTRK